MTIVGDTKLVKCYIIKGKRGLKPTMVLNKDTSILMQYTNFCVAYYKIVLLPKLITSRNHFNIEPIATTIYIEVRFYKH